MVVVMAPDATDEQIAARRRARRERRRRGVRQPRRRPHHHRARRRHRLLPRAQPAQPARSRGRAPDLRPVQAGQPPAPRRTLDGLGRSAGPPGADRPGDVHVHRRAVRGRDAPSRPSRPRRWPRRAGATLLRGGAFKPRTSPYAFQGLGVRGPRDPGRGARGDRPADRHRGGRRPRRAPWSPSTPTCCRSAPATCRTSGCCRRSASAGKPVLLKRGMTATIEEWLMAAEYVAQRGNLDIVLCERGIRTFEPAMRNTLDISAVPVVQAHQPPADHRRPVARGRPQGPRRATGPGRDRGRRRRHDRRRAPAPRGGAVRRSAGAVRWRPARAGPGGVAGSRRWWAGSTPPNGDQDDSTPVIGRTQ